jgi:hypothetical protein
MTSDQWGGNAEGRSSNAEGRSWRAGRGFRLCFSRSHSPTPNRSLNFRILSISAFGFRYSDLPPAPWISNFKFQISDCSVSPARTDLGSGRWPAQLSNFKSQISDSCHLDIIRRGRDDRRFISAISAPTRRHRVWVGTTSKVGRRVPATAV